MKIGIIIIVIVIVGIFLLIPSQYNPLTPKGVITGEFVRANHRGYGGEDKMKCEMVYCRNNNVGLCKIKNPKFKVVNNMPLSNGTRVVCDSIEYKK